MSGARFLREYQRQREAEDKLEAKWDALVSGEASEEEDAELQALAERSLEARAKYELFRPIKAATLDRMADNIVRALDARTGRGEDAREPGHGSKMRDKIRVVGVKAFEGRTLEDLLKARGRLKPALAAHIGAEIAHAVAVEHAAQRIHRDIRPGNILFPRHEGMPEHSFMIELRPFESPDIPRDVATTGGYAFGPPIYMSPEQCRGPRDVDRRTDIYSLGIVIYEMLTGVYPFASPTTIGIVSSILFTPAHRPSAKVRDIPPELDDIVALCTAANRDERHLDAAELSLALKTIARNLSDSSISSSRELTNPVGTMDTAGRVDEPGGRLLLRQAGFTRIAPGKGNLTAGSLAPEWGASVAATLLGKVETQELQSPDPAGTTSSAGALVSSSKPSKETTCLQQKPKSRFGTMILGLALSSALLVAIAFGVTSGMPITWGPGGAKVATRAQVNIGPIVAALLARWPRPVVEPVPPLATTAAPLQPIPSATTHTVMMSAATAAPPIPKDPRQPNPSMKKPEEVHCKGVGIFKKCRGPFSGGL